MFLSDAIKMEVLSMGSTGKVALVTGAGSGIGRAVALALLGEGYSVTLTGRRSQPLEEAAAAGPKGGQALIVPSDVGDPGSVGAVSSTTSSPKVMSISEPNRL